MERALWILEVLGRSQKGLGVRQISEATGLPGATVHRLLATLSANGFVLQDGSRKYSPGLKLLSMAGATRERVGRLVLPFLSDLMEVSQETANLAILEQNSTLYIEQVAPPGRLLRMFTEPGNRVPLHAAATGKVLLAYQPSRVTNLILEQVGLPRQTPKTITNRAQLQSELRRVRQQEYATDFEEQEEGVHCLAAPILSAKGDILAALSLSGPAPRLGRQRLITLMPDIKRIARGVSEVLISAP